MEITLKWIGICFNLLYLQLCNGKPINSEDTFTEVNDPNQLVTALVILLTICSLVFIGGCLCCQRRNAPKRFRDSPVVASGAPDYDHGHVNPVANGEFTIFTPLSPHLNNNIFLASEPVIPKTFENYSDNGFDLSPWFSENEKDFPRVKLKYIKELGRGWFGKVVQGAAQDIGENGQIWTPVVVRILDATSSQKEKVLFLQDAFIYKCGHHPNILALIGRCLDTVPFLLLQEYCPQGDLKAYLRANKANAEKLLSGEYPLLWCCQLTSALKFLHHNKICHPDLAARNCQLTSSLVLKLGDYGLAVFRYPGDYYQSSPGVPLRWCAPESLNCTQTTIQPKVVTAEGNIWALGVTMWEVYECGEQPYAGLTDDEVIAQVLGPPALRLDRPKCSVLYTDYIFRLMQLCWATNAEERPTVTRIDLMLSDLLQVQKNANNTISADSSLSVDDFDRRWETFKPNYIVKTDHVADTVSVEIHEPGIRNPFVDNFSFNRLSSGSETEEENWRYKVERGAYTEKVRMKSRSVADLMVLTHVDYSESESETPLPSLDYRVNYKNVRLAPANNLESANLTFGSEGNLLSVENTFQEELKKLKEERRDSLLFVPDNCSHNDSNSIKNENGTTSVNPANLIHELNDTAEIKPANQIYNVFKVTIEHSPIHVNKKLNEIIFNDCSQLSFDTTLQDLPKDTCIYENSSCDSNLENISGMAENSCAEFESHVDLVRGSVEHDNTQNRGDLESVIDESRLELSDSERSREDSIRILSEKLVEEILNEAKQKEISIRSLSEKMADKILFDAKYEQSSIQTLSRKLVEKILSDAKHTIEQFPKNGLIPKLSEKKLNNMALMDSANYQNLLSENTLNIWSSSDKVTESPESQNIQRECVEPNSSLPTVQFDISSNQEQAMPNSLTHSSIFCSTPFRKKDISLPSEDVYTSMTLFRDENQIVENENKELNYSLETWDNFLGRTLDQSENLFDSFSSEPQSLLFIDDKNATYGFGDEHEIARKELDNTYEVNGGYEDVRKELTSDTFVLDSVAGSIVSSTNTDGNEEPFDVMKQDPTPTNEEVCRTFVKDDLESAQANTEDCKDSWESGGGWFLHPQTYNEYPSGELQMQPTTSDSYVGFGIDDEIMSAIRNELLSKLPHAQGASSERVKDDEEEWDSCERNEVFLKYNVYNTPLSPIPEESCIDELSGLHSPKQENDENVDSDWSGQCEAEALPQDTGSNSPHDSPYKGPLHRHTPSQDSCCSNDTLFNLEELTAVEKEADSHPKTAQSPGVSEENKENRVPLPYSTNIINAFIFSDSENANRTYVIEEEKSEESTLNCKVSERQDICNSKPQNSNIEIFLTKERDYSSRLLWEPQDHSKSESTEENTPPFPVKQLVPLPSPEDNPWRQLPASLLTYNKAIAQTANPFLHDAKPVPETNEDNIEIDESPPETHDNLPELNLDSIENEDVRDEKEYEDFVNMENAKNSLEYCNLAENNEYIYDRTENDNSDDENIYGILTDIRFNGPSDAQLMSTSFSESNNCDDQEWDSGSESRSSSSGEFIWKMDDIKPMECIREGINEESDISSTFSEDEDGETPEFVPSAWDRFAMPGKSALRSPEKVPKKSEEKKSKAVWFKKQKYQCVYEYPKEPDSPVSQTTDLWKPPSQADYNAFIDWDFDGELSMSQTDEPEKMSYYPKTNTVANNLYHLISIPDFVPKDTAGMDDEFFISSSARPFDLRNSLSSQFFPGNSGWPDSATPDSGLEDFTPSGGQTQDSFAKSVPTLKQLASNAVNKKKQLEKNRENLGGLRHQKNKLKLDLPPSPSAFTSEKLFTIDPPSLEPVHVQHVDTPSDDADSKNVSFEALPYKPLQEIQLKDNEKEFVRNHKNRRESQEMERNIIKNENSDICNLKIEIVRGEASLLDSADEDSGIESSTLERKLSAT
nr:unnamed protein product [Callosobruchus analis]